MDVAALKAHLDTRLDELPDEVAKAVRTDPRLWASGGRISQVMERNGLFTGRKNELALLRETLKTHRKAHLFGLGGMGKTQTALEYAHAFGDAYPQGVLWARAENTSVLEEDYRLFAALLRLPQATTPEIALVCEAVRQELSAHGGYLLVLDNVEDLGSVAPYLPSGGTGHVLVTTRISQIVPRETGVHLERLDDEAGADLLLKRAGKERNAATERPAALEFSRTVDGLPLALDQAGAYLAASGGTVVSYQVLYQQSGEKLRRKRGEQAHILHESVARTYEVAVQKLAEVWPEDSEDEETAAVARVAAVEFLRLCAFLAPEDIPDVIIKGAGPHLTESLQKCTADPLVYDATIMRVLKFSLMTSRTDPTYVYGTQLFSLHRTVQEVIQDTLSEVENNEYQHLAITAVAYSHPADWNTRWDHYRHLAAHAQHIVTFVTEKSVETENAGLFCSQLGFHKFRQADYASALPLYERALAISKKALGADHPDTATSLNNLAALYQTQGDYSSALPLYERALAIRETALGADHPDTAQSLNNLAVLYFYMGRKVDAVPLLKRAFEIFHKALGRHHRNTQTILQSLLGLLNDLGLWEDALPLLIFVEKST
ncbi:tetratricopeptide repeat protein [Armatimonas sp.]|uniref:tetratricopeptide repeat protein n=1 Tax=Armatimonas sp. TaxID=1872638 RepID=UPI00374D3D73